IGLADGGVGGVFVGGPGDDDMCVGFNLKQRHEKLLSNDGRLPMDQHPNCTTLRRTNCQGILRAPRHRLGWPSRYGLTSRFANVWQAFLPAAYLAAQH